MTDKEQILARLRVLEMEGTVLQVEAVELRKLLMKPEEPETKTWSRWKPKAGERYYFVGYDGTSSHLWNGDYTDRSYHSSGNCFPTREAAERHNKRLRSMVPTCPVPKDGDVVWFASYYGSPYELKWDGSPGNRAAYSQGRIKTSKKECDAWHEEFASAWTTLEDAS